MRKRGYSAKIYVKKKPGETNPSGGAMSEPEKEKYVIHGDKSLPQIENPLSEQLEAQQNTTANASNLSPRKKARKNAEMVVTPRRSSRLQRPFLTCQSTEIERVMEQITISESDNEDETPINENMEREPPEEVIENEEDQTLGDENVESEQPEDVIANKNLEGKVDYVLEQLGVLMSKNKKKSSPVKEHLFPADSRYRCLYIDSQKMIETLRNENRQLSLKLEYALGKLEAYEKGYERGTNFCSEVLVKVRDVISAFHGTSASSAGLANQMLRSGRKRHR